MSCRIGDLSLSINWFVCEFFSVGEFLSPSCYSVSCLSVSCRVTGSYTLGYQKHNFPFQMCLFIFKVLKRETIRKLRLGECPGNDILFLLSASFDFLLANK